MTKPIAKAHAFRVLRRNLFALPAALLPIVTQAQAPKLRKVGVLIDGSAPNKLPGILRKTLLDKGYVEGTTIQFDVRYADGNPSRASELAADLVRNNVDIIVAHFTPAVRAAREATSSIPIIMAPAGAPVETGLVVSLAHPGGNVTGVTNMAAELGRRRLELLKYMMPDLRKVAVLAAQNDVFTNPFMRFLVEAAASSNIRLLPINAKGPEDFDTAFKRIAEEQAGALIVQGFFNSQRAAILQLASQNRVATAWFDREAVVGGGLFSLATETTSIYERAARMTAMVLAGANPATLPIQQPDRYELVINLKTARALNIKVPSEVSLSASELIE